MISEVKKKIVVDNYFKQECTVNTSIREAYEKGFNIGLMKAPNDNKNELLDYVTESIEAEKKIMGSCHDLASEDYHKGIIYAFECIKMKLM